MGIKTYNPYTPSRRHMTGLDFTDVTKSKMCIRDRLIGDYVTSLDMNGAALTVMKLDEELKELLDYDAKAPGLK